MAIVYPYNVQCDCGATISANLADGVNVGRTPAIREQILAGTFHRVSCPSCKRTVTAEKSFFYTDAKRRTYIQVKPRQDRHLWREASHGLKHAIERSRNVDPDKKATVRVVFGMAELREKLIAEDLKIDDRAVELLKVALLNEHPFLMHRPRLRLMLDSANAKHLEFIAAFDHDKENFRLSVPMEAARDFLDNKKRLRSWTHEAGHKQPLFEMKDDYWINMWRWSPQPDALEKLKQVAAQLRNGANVDVDAPEFAAMLEGLPRGAHLPSWAKVDLQLLFNHAASLDNEELKDALFEIRFAKTLADDWSTNKKRDDIDTLWQLLQALPPTNVEGNAHISDINMEQDKGGGFYEPQTGDIYIGSRALSDQENFEDIMRHEVGHGVHEARLDDIDAWLASEFGWHMFAPKKAGLDQWIELMGGWETLGASDAEQRDVLRFLTISLGDGSSWSAGPSPNVPAGHIWWQRDFGPRLACERSGANWYEKYPNWYRVNGQAFFLNYYYATLCTVSEETLDLIAKMPSSYAAMSTFEFFAELYALYYDLDDRGRDMIPRPIRQWLDQNVGQAQARPARPMTRPREAFETIARPSG